MSDQSGRSSRKTGIILRVSILAIFLAAGGFLGTDWLKHRIDHVFENDARIAADMVSVSSRVGGWIADRPIVQGDQINIGDVLVKIDAREARFRQAELQARIAEIAAERARVKAEIAMMEDQTRHRYDAQRSRMNAAAAALMSMTTDLGLKRSEYTRVKSLAGRSIVSRQRLERAEAELRAAEEAKRSAEADLAANRSMLLEARADRRQTLVRAKRLDQLKAEVERVTAQLEQQKLDVKDRTILSPIQGVVDRTFVDKGEFVRPGQRLALIHDPSKIWIEANIRETDLREVEIGAPVKISVDAFPDRQFEGKVLRIGDATTSEFALLPNPNPSGSFTKITQRVPVRIIVDQLDRRLRPGMMVEIDIVARRR